MDYMEASTISDIKIHSFWCLVSRRREILLSRNARVKILFTIFPLALIPNIYMNI